MTADVVAATLRPDDLALLEHLARDARGGRVALVGGAVRDALLGLVPLDLDVVVEGSGVRALAESTGLPFTYHERYDNATVTLPDGRPLDLVRARAETYARPGASPDVLPGTLHDDLARRDYAVNAMALVLGQRELLDPHGGLADLEARRLAPLHAYSLRDDPSRLARAARLAARLGFDLSSAGRSQVPLALQHAPDTPRLTSEFHLVLGEARPGAVLDTLRRWNATPLFGADATSTLLRLDACRAEGQTVSPTTYAAAWLGRQPDASSVAARLELGERATRLLERARSDRPFPPGSPESQVRQALDLPEPTPRLSGADVIALGVPPGPAVGRALAHLDRLRREGRVHTLDDERAALHDHLRGVSQ